MRYRIEERLLTALDGVRDVAREALSDFATECASNFSQ